MSEVRMELDRLLSHGPQSALEHRIIEEYLLGKGYHLADLKDLPEEQAKGLMKDACLHAALKLAEIESRDKFRHKIQAPGV